MMMVLLKMMKHSVIDFPVNQVQGHHGLQGMKLVLTMSTSPPAEEQ